MKKRIGAMILSIALALATMPVSVFAATEASGTCGEGVTWNLSDGTLTIAGTGAVTSAPWSAYKDDIRHIVIDMPAGTFTSTYGNYINISFSGYCNVSQVDFVQYPLQSLTGGDGKTYEGLKLSERMFGECIGLTNMVVPTQVTNLPQFAFIACENMESVTLPETLRSIGSHAFASCYAVQSIHIPSSTRKIGTNAFSACNSLTRIELPYGIEEISEGLFQYCHALQSVNIPASVNKIGKGAFWGCGVRSITIPGKVSSIGAEAFLNCGNLNSLTMNEGLEFIYVNAFKDCYQLTNITIPDSVQEIYAGAFNTGRDALHVGFQGETLPKIASSSFSSGATLRIPCLADGDYGVYGNYQLDLVHGAVVDNKCSVCGAAISNEGSGSTGEGEIPSGTLTYTLSTAKGQYLYYDIATGYITGYSAEQPLTDLVIPDTIEGYKVKGIKGRAFRNCSSLVSLETNAAYIGIRAFENCYNLKTIHLTGAEKIKSYAFSNCCNALESVTLPDTLTYMGYYAFQNCSMLKSISFPDGMQSIGTGALRWTNMQNLILPISCKLYGNTFGWNWISLDTLTLNCGSSDGILRRQNISPLGNIEVKNVVLGKGITEIAYRAFSGRDIYHVSLPLTLEKIANRAFDNCFNLESINLSNIKTIGVCSFESCWNLKTADLSSIQELKNYAFRECISLTGVTIGNQLQRIPDWAFGNCGALTTVTFAKDAALSDIGRFAFYCCISLDGIVLPDNVTNVAGYAFERCTALQNLTLPASLQTLGYAAFNRCESLEAVTLPNSVRDLAYGVFGNCTNLSQLNLNEGLESVGDAIISNTKIDSLTVPESVVSIADRAFTQCETLANLTLPISAEYSKEHDGWLVASNPNLVNIIFTPGTGEGVNFDMNTTKETPWYLNKENPGFRVQFTDGIKSIGEYAFAYNNFTAVDQLPASVERIGDYAFFRNKQLQSVKLREGLKKIGYQAFAECEPLTEAVLPASLTTIKSNSFMGDDDMVATVCKNSAALAYCQKYGIPYKLSGSDTIQLPDLPEAKEVGSLQVGKEIYAKSDTELLVPITLTSNPGITSLVLNLDYDHTALELTDVSPGDALSSGQWNLRNGNGALSTEALYWDNNSGDQNVNGSGMLAILHFALKENAKYGQEYSIKATTEGDNGGAFDSDGSAVQFVCKDGWVEVDDFVYGNVTADLENVIDMMDVAQLKWFISRNWALEEIQQKAGDVNRDGKINALDAMILERHIAKWSGYGKLPYVKQDRAV